MASFGELASDALLRLLINFHMSFPLMFVLAPSSTSFQLSVLISIYLCWLVLMVHHSGLRIDNTYWLVCEVSSMVRLFDEVFFSLYASQWLNSRCCWVRLSTFTDQFCREVRHLFVNNFSKILSNFAGRSVICSLTIFLRFSQSILFHHHFGLCGKPGW